MTKIRSAAAASLLMLLVVPQAAQAADASGNSIGRGQYTPSGDHQPSNDSYCLGLLCNDVNDYFILLVPSPPSVDEGITDATLSVVNPFGGGVPRPFVLHDVTTSFADLEMSHDPSAEGRAIFRDLENGVEFGRTTPASVDDAVIPVQISEPRGLLSLNRALGQPWAVGGSLLSDDDADFLFGSSSDEAPSSIAIGVDFGPKTALTIQAPNKVAKGRRVTVSGDLSSSSQPCVDTVELEVDAGATSRSVMTDSSGHYSFKQRITRRTKVSVLDPGDASCAPSQASKTIKVA